MGTKTCKDMEVGMKNEMLTENMGINLVKIEVLVEMSCEICML